MRKLTFISFLILVFLIPWEDSVTNLPIGSLARLAGLAVAGLWLVTIVLEGRFRRLEAFHGLVLIFFLWNAVTLFWSLDVPSTIQRIQTYAQIFILILIAWDLLQKRADLLLALQAYILGSYVLVGSTVQNYLAGNIAVQYEGRYSATGVNANDVALILILGMPVGLPIAMELFFAASKTVGGLFLQLIDILYIPLSIFAIVLTGSRTSLIAVVPFVAYLVTTERIKMKWKLMIFMALLLFLLVLIPFAPPGVIARMATVGSSIGQADMGGRVTMWRLSIAVLAHHPVFGVGAGAVDRLIGGAVHNTFISVATETGVIGFTLLILVLGIVINALGRMPKGTLALWLTIFVTWLIGVISLSWEFRKVSWIILSFIIIEASLVAREVAERGGVALLQSGEPVTEPAQPGAEPRAA